MKTLGSREFQLTYSKLTEPVRVERRGKLMGIWHPAHKTEDGTTVVKVAVSVPEGWVPMAHREEPPSKT